MIYWESPPLAEQDLIQVHNQVSKAVRRSASAISRVHWVCSLDKTYSESLRLNNLGSDGFSGINVDFRVSL